MYRQDEIDEEIRIFLEISLDRDGFIDNSTIDRCIKENKVSFYNVEQILMGMLDDELIKEHETKYLRI